MKIRPRDRIALGVVLAVVAALAFYTLAISPEYHKATGLDAQIATERASLTQAQQQYAAGLAARMSLQATATEWAAAQRAVPQSSNVPALLRLLEHESAAADVKLQNISLGGSTGTSSAPQAGTSSSGVTEIPVSLSLAGGSQAFDRLVGRLDGLVAVSGHGVRASGPLISISNVSLSGTGSRLTVQLSANLYQRAAASSVLGSASQGTS